MTCPCNDCRRLPGCDAAHQRWRHRKDDHQQARGAQCIPTPYYQGMYQCSCMSVCARLRFFLLFGGFDSATLSVGVHDYAWCARIYVCSHPQQPTHLFLNLFLNMHTDEHRRLPAYIFVKKNVHVILWTYTPTWMCFYISCIHESGGAKHEQAWKT